MTTTTLGPTRRSERALAPDLIRGAMLLFIALANAGNCAFAGQPGLDPDPHGLARVLNFGLSLLVDSRAYPVFAIMFGYGLVQIARRQEAAGGDARRVLVRRNAWLVGFGLVHATLLYFGDFLGAYGLIGLAATFLLVRRSDRFHRAVLWVWGLQSLYLVVLPVLALTHDWSGGAGLVNSPNPSLAADSYRASIGDRLAEWPAHTLSVLPAVFIVWLGIWAARRGILENVDQHRTLLVRTAVIGLGIAVLGGLPYALVAAGVLHPAAGTVDILSLLHDVSGEYAGPGYIAAIALLGARLSRTGRVGAVAALGQRSLSGYLFQSVCWLVLFTPFALDLGGHTVVAVLAAIGVWLASVALAAALQRRGHPGPAEKVLRRLTYGRR
ncbi:DUF418 domain-containing protein [Nocardioides sp. LML1-1-1.1]|uniref:DUF418 domain-containing protein n=1 Tax=Nocardioides sp. LML1-1-1.1 TaxID=3135248 RepID=UPI0034169187